MPYHDTSLHFVNSKEWARPAETSIWNTSPINMLFFILVAVTLLNCKSLQKHKNSCPRKHPCWTQVNNLTTLKEMDETIWKLDLKYFTNKDAILHTH